MKARTEFVSDRTELLKLEPLTADFAAQAGMGGQDLFALQVVLEELVTNVIDYGGIPAGEPAAVLELETDGGELTIRLDDCGREYNPLLRADPDTSLPAEERQVGGLGVFFCKKLTDEQTYARVGNRNILTLKRRLTA